MGLRIAFRLTDGAYIPMSVFIAEPGTAVRMGSTGEETADIALRIAAAIGEKCRSLSDSQFRLVLDIVDRFLEAVEEERERSGN